MLPYPWPGTRGAERPQRAGREGAAIAETRRAPHVARDADPGPAAAARDRDQQEGRGGGQQRQNFRDEPKRGDGPKELRRLAPRDLPADEG